VDEAPHAGLGAGGEHVARALDVAALEVLPRPEVGDMGGEVKGDVAARRCIGE
jgi:hypothetical protein